MRACILIVAAMLCRPAAAQQRFLFEAVRTLPSTFERPSKENTPTKAEQNTARRLAQEWLKLRTAGQKSKLADWEFVGEFLGKPLDDRPRRRHQVYRGRFRRDVDLGGQKHHDVIFYFAEGELICPPEELGVDKAIPGQMIAVVRENLKG